MRRILHIFLIAFCSSVSIALAENCQYGTPNSCKKDFFCVNVDKDVTECRQSFNLPLLTLNFPFESRIKVVCDQGPLSPATNSHTWVNTAFAVDLQSDRSLEAVTVFSGVAGKVIAYDECKTEDDQCGLGFGNSVKILTEDGYLAFYAHLKKVFVKTGETIKTGEKIGIEGTTGWTGKGNRHLHISLHHDWRNSGFEYWKGVGYLPASVPFKLGCQKQEIDVREIECRRTTKEPKAICNG